MVMDLKLILTTFSLVFLAELGDKTQLAAFCISADCSSSKLSVFLGSASALVMSSLIAVFLGDTISRLVHPNYIKIGAGSLFVIMGIWILITATKGICTISG
jgi:putative Ca2+/H+ antiporter (TMEM165/GDT1 family)